MIQGGNRKRLPGSVRTPLISIIIVVFNGQRTLERALQSIFSKNCSEVECIVIDGNSTDRTVEILQQYDESIAFWLSEPDGGIYDAMNKGVTFAHGQFIYFLGCDDIFEVDPTELLCRLKDPTTIYYGNVVRPGNQSPYAGKFNSWKLTRRNICHQAIFYPRIVFEVRKFAVEYRVWADWELNVRCYGDVTLKFSYMPLIVATWSDGGFSAGVTDAIFLQNRGDLYRSCFPFHIYLLYLLERWIKTMIRACVSKS